MRSFVQVVSVLGTLVLASQAASPDPHPTPRNQTTTEPTSVVIIFKDGHQETYAMADIARIEYKSAGDSALGLDHFLGKWEVGDGNSGTFFITFEANGEASRSLGASHGIWTIVGDEARISWDDGWHDVIREINKKQHEKLAFAPDTAFDDKPANVAAAWRIKGTKIKSTPK